MRTILILLVPLMLLGQTGLDIARKIDQRAEPTDMVSDMTMILTNKKGQTRTQKIHSVMQGREKQIIWFLEPADDRGVAFLKIEHKDRDDEMRIWLPGFGKMRRISSSKKAENFMGSDLTYEDMTSRDLDDYTFELLREDELDGAAVWVLQSNPKPELRSAYSRIVSWVRQADALPVKEEYYNRSGKLEKIRVVTTEQLQGYTIVTRMFVENVLKNHTTELLFDKIKVDTGVKDNLFHERNLRRLPR